MPCGIFMMVHSVLSVLRVSRAHCNFRLGWGGGGSADDILWSSVSYQKQPWGPPPFLWPVPRLPGVSRCPSLCGLSPGHLSRALGELCRRGPCHRPGRQEEQALRSVALLQLGCGLQQAVGCLAIPLAAGPWIHACPPGLNLGNCDFWALFLESTRTLLERWGIQHRNGRLFHVL